MIKTVKKFSKKSLSLLIALIMVFSAMPLTPPISVEAATDTSALSKAISAYENKMNGTIYTNMKDAYNKYILACEAYDAITYGDANIDINSIANELVTSTNNMGTYTEPTFNAKVYHSGTTTEAIGGYSNVVYYNGVTSWGGQSGTDAWTQKAYVKFKPALPQTLVLVDNGGTDNVYSPAVIQVNNGDTVGTYNKSKTFRYIKLNSTPSSSYYSVNLKQKWDMGVVAWNSWVDPSTIESPVNHIQNSTDRSEAVNDDNNRLACNRLYFSAKTNDGDTSDYYEKLSVSDIKFGVDVYSTWQNAIWQNKSSEQSGEVYSNGTYYILNYRPIKTKLSSAKTNLTNALNGKNVSSYKEGGLGSLLQLIDKCTADNVDPTKCAYSSGVETAVTSCAKNIKAVDEISVPNVTEDSNQTIYGNLKTEIVTYNTIIANNTYNNHQLSDYTDDSIADAKTALNEAKNFMKTVYTNGYADSSTATSKYNAMVTAKEGLTLKSYKVTFKYADDSPAVEKVYNIGTLASNITKPNNTASYYDNANHYSYSWPTIYDVTGDATYDEIVTTEKHTSNGTATQTTTKDEQGRTLQVHQKTCSVCKAEYIENHNLTITGTTASCSDCDYSVSSDYKSNGFRITKGNLFDVDAYAATDSATISPNSGAVSVDTVNDTITVAGLKYDAYTNYAAKGNYYRLPVSRLSYYTISYTPSSDNNQVFCFFSDGESGDYKYNEKYNDSKYGAPANQEYKLTFQALESYVDFRFGTVESGGICTFSNISFYESDANGNPTNGYKVLASNVPNDANVLNSLNIPSADKCNASYSMTGKTGKISSTDTIATNLNITLDTEHAYGNFTNDYTNGSVYNKNTTYTHSRSCSDCGYIDTKSCTFGDLVINGNTATLKCSVCHGTYTLDYSAYNAELKVLDGMLAETNKYSNTENCISERNSVNDSATSSESDIRTQDDVDAKINELKEIENKLTLKKYSITFNVATVDGKTLATNITGTGTYNYGTMVELDLPEQYQTNYVVTTWKRYAKGEDKVVGATSTKLYVVVNQESTYTAVINSVATGTVGENQAVLTLNNKSGKTVDVGIVDTNQEQTVTVNIADSKIKIGSVELTAPTYSFYTLKGFYIDKTLYSESGGTVTITKDTVITPYYDASLFVNIDRDSDETFTINNENTASYKAKWNQRVTLKSSKEVMWLDENDVVLAQGTTYSFYANSNVTIKTKAVGSVENVAPTTSIGYFDYDSTLNKVTVVNNFFVPDGKTVTEAGAILSTKNSTVDALKKQTNGIFKGGPESFTSTGNQIRISVSRTANTPFTMYVLAYVVVDGTTYYANEVKSINYTPKSA